MITIEPPAALNMLAALLITDGGDPRAAIEEAFQLGKRVGYAAAGQQEAQARAAFAMSPQAQQEAMQNISAPSEERWIQLDPPEAIAGWHIGMAWSLPEEGTLARVTAVARAAGGLRIKPMPADWMPSPEINASKEYLLKAQIADLEAELAELRLMHARCRR